MSSSQDNANPPPGGTQVAASTLVEPKKRLRQRFYEPLVLLLAATQACMHNLAPKSLESAPDSFGLTQEQLFHNFINKMAQICDSKRGGDTVTSAVALQYPEKIQYRFASNQRNRMELETVRLFVNDILLTLQRWTGESPGSPRSSKKTVIASLLQKIIGFNRPRLQHYVKQVAEKSETCLEIKNLPSEVLNALRDLQELSRLANDKELSEDEFFRRCTSLMILAKKLSRSSTHRIFRDKANETRPGEENPWHDLRHAAGRLLNYLEATQTLVEARGQPGWERLFHEFEVKCIPSSQPHPNPMKKGVLNAQQILGRMESTIPHGAEGGIEALREGAEDLQRFDLDKHIRTQAESNTFRPIVHAEVLIHESIVTDRDVRDTRPSRFFNGYAYIGSSKPTCRLCEYYFRVVGDDVQVRKSHRNLYRNWRVPDVRAGQDIVRGRQAEKRREDILNGVVKWIRQDAYRILCDKISERKQDDSNTSRTYQLEGLDTECSSLAGPPVERDVDDVASVMGQLDLED